MLAVLGRDEQSPAILALAVLPISRVTCGVQAPESGEVSGERGKGDAIAILWPPVSLAAELSSVQAGQ